MGIFSKKKQKSLPEINIEDRVFSYFDENRKLYNLVEILAAEEELCAWIASGKVARIRNKHLIDALVDLGYYKENSADIMKSYLIDKYKDIKFGRVIVSGVDKKNQLVEDLLRFGNNVYVQDRDIILNQKLAKEKGFLLNTSDFTCDYRRNIGVKLDKYNHVLGLQPDVNVAESMIRQGIIYEKPVDIMLPNEEGKTLTGRDIQSVFELAEYLEGISKDVTIRIKDGQLFASNVSHPRVRESEDENTLER